MLSMLPYLLTLPYLRCLTLLIGGLLIFDYGIKRIKKSTCTKKIKRMIG